MSTRPHPDCSYASSAAPRKTGWPPTDKRRITTNQDKQSLVTAMNVSLTWGHFMFACLAAARSASSLPFHLMRNMSSPLLSVAPMILSAWRPRSKPRGRISSLGWSFLLGGNIDFCYLFMLRNSCHGMFSVWKNYSELFHLTFNI